MTSRRAVAIAVASLILVGAVAAVALNGSGGDGDDVAGGGGSSTTSMTTTGDTTSTTAGGGVRATASSEAVLHRFDDCGSVLDEARKQALAQVTPYGLPYSGSVVLGTGGPEMAPTAGGDSAAGSAGGGRSAAPSATAADGNAGAAYSGTNLQEAGVDEPDIVKNDGRRAFTLVGRRLRSVLFDGDGSIRAGDSIDLDVPGDAELLQVGENVVVLSPAGDGISTRVIVVDGRDPGSLEVLRQIDVEGTYLSARQIGDTIRLVVTQNGPAFDFTYPQSDTETEKKRALAVNRAAIQRAKLAEWLPDVTFDGTRRLVPAPACDDIYLTKSFAGPGSTSVITLSPTEGKVLDATSVMATATEVYATTDHLYVATSVWRQPEGDVAPSVAETTEIHRFDISDPRKSVYEASGSVAGHLLRPPWFVPSGPIAQWAMSEHGDDLRVATTVMNQTGIENAITVLRPVAGALTPIGTVTGIARGEQLYAVRFMGDRGYLVTYKRVDPLFVLDLSNPRAPRVVGELKVPGYSAYLHPIGDGLLLGIGQDDPDEDGFADGSQVSVFDVSDPARPLRLGQLKLGERGSVAGVESDPRTFTWWARPARAVLTLTNWSDQSAFQGAVALEPGRAGIREVGRIREAAPSDGCGMPVSEFRTRVIGDRLVLFSSTGVRSSDLDDLAPRASLTYGDAGASAPCPEPQPQPSPAIDGRATPFAAGRD